MRPPFLKELQEVVATASLVVATAEYNFNAAQGAFVALASPHKGFRHAASVS